MLSKLQNLVFSLIQPGLYEAQTRVKVVDHSLEVGVG